MWWVHSGEVAGALAQRRGRREKGRENPKDPEGREGRKAQDGNRGYLQQCPRAAVWLALAALALEPAAPPGALGHPGMALAGAPRLTASSQPRRGGVGPRSQGGARPSADCWRELVGVVRFRVGWARGGRGPSRRGAPPEAWVRRGRGGRSARGVGRGRGGALPGAGWALWIAKGCGLATTAEPRGERAQEEGIFFKS